MRRLRYLPSRELLERRLKWPENLSTEGRSALRTLLKANKRLNIAYLLKESFSQLWEYRQEGWARKFFDNWKASLKWQKLRPYEEFAEMIERHWDGIVAFIQLEEKVSLGFVEGLNNKSYSVGLMGYEMKNIFASRFLPVCYRPSNRQISPTQLGEEPKYIITGIVSAWLLFNLVISIIAELRSFYHFPS
jgi:hypothetical protein